MEELVTSESNDSNKNDSKEQHEEPESEERYQVNFHSTLIAQPIISKAVSSRLVPYPLLVKMLELAAGKRGRVDDGEELNQVPLPCCQSFLASALFDLYLNLSALCYLP